MVGSPATTGYSGPIETIMANTVWTPGSRTTDGAVGPTKGRLGAVILRSGSAAAAVDVYDDAAAASGTVLCALAVDAANKSETFVAKDDGVRFVRGLFIDITGAGALVVVHYA